MYKKLIGITFAAFALVGCGRLAVIHNYDDVPVVRFDNATLTLDDMDRAIHAGGMRYGWVVRKVAPGHDIARLSLRNHVAIVDVLYTPESYSIHYKSSDNLLDNGQGMIHKHYNTWAMNLHRAIDAAIQQVPVKR